MTRPVSRGCIFQPCPNLTQTRVQRVRSPTIAPHITDSCPEGAFSCRLTTHTLPILQTRVQRVRSPTIIAPPITDSCPEGAFSNHSSPYYRLVSRGCVLLPSHNPYPPYITDSCPEGAFSNHYSSPNNRLVSRGCVLQPKLLILQTRVQRVRSPAMTASACRTRPAVMVQKTAETGPMNCSVR